MIWRDVITLITATTTTNDIGDAVTSETSKDVYCNKKSIRQSEFYQAQQTGFKPEVMFEMRNVDYSSESALLYEGKRYSVIRTYSKNGEVIELICSSLVSEV